MVRALETIRGDNLSILIKVCSRCIPPTMQDEYTVDELQAVPPRGLHPPVFFFQKNTFLLGDFK